MIRKPVLNMDSPVYEQNLSLQILKRREPLKCVIRAVSAKTCRKLAELRPIIVSKLAPFPFYFGAISENIMRQIMIGRTKSVRGMVSKVLVKR